MAELLLTKNLYCAGMVASPFERERGRVRVWLRELTIGGLPLTSILSPSEGERLVGWTCASVLHISFAPS
jgi:hypothetical protein